MVQQLVGETKQSDSRYDEAQTISISIVASDRPEHKDFRSGSWKLSRLGSLTDPTTVQWQRQSFPSRTK